MTEGFCFLDSNWSSSVSDKMEKSTNHLHQLSETESETSEKNEVLNESEEEEEESSEESLEEDSDEEEEEKSDDYNSDTPPKAKKTKVEVPKKNRRRTKKEIADEFQLYVENIQQKINQMKDNLEESSKIMDSLTKQKQVKKLKSILTQQRLDERSQSLKLAEKTFHTIKSSQEQQERIPSKFSSIFKTINQVIKKEERCAEEFQKAYQETKKTISKNKETSMIKKKKKKKKEKNKVEGKKKEQDNSILPTSTPSTTPTTTHICEWLKKNKDEGKEKEQEGAIEKMLPSLTPSTTTTHICEFPGCEWKVDTCTLSDYIELLKIHVLARHSQNNLQVNRPRVNRIKLNTLKQNCGEPVRVFADRVRRLASLCEYTIICTKADCMEMVNYTESVIMDQIICGLVDTEIQRDVLSHTESNIISLETLLKYVEDKESNNVSQIL